MHLASFVELDNGVEFVLFSNSSDELHERVNEIARALNTNVCTYIQYRSFHDIDSEVTFNLSNLDLSYNVAKDFFKESKLPFED